MPASGVNASLSVVTPVRQLLTGDPGPLDLDVEHVSRGRVLDRPGDGPDDTRAAGGGQDFTGIATRPVEPLHEHELVLPAAVKEGVFGPWVDGGAEEPHPRVSVIVLAAVPLLTNRTVPPWTGFDAIGLNALSVIVILYLGATVRFTVARPLFVLPSLTRKVTQSAPE